MRGFLRDMFKTIRFYKEAINSYLLFIVVFFFFETLLRASYEIKTIEADQDEGVVYSRGKMTKIIFGEPQKTVPSFKRSSTVLLETKSLFHCHGICIRGKTSAGNIVRALYHWDSITEIETLFSTLKNIMITHHHAVPQSISTRLFGTLASAEWKNELLVHKEMANIVGYYIEKRADGEESYLDVCMSEQEDFYRLGKLSPQDD